MWNTVLSYGLVLGVRLAGWLQGVMLHLLLSLARKLFLLPPGCVDKGCREISEVFFWEYTLAAGYIE